MENLQCKELIEIFKKVGGTFLCEYDSKTCYLFPNNINCKIKSENKEDIDTLLSDFAYSPNYDEFVSDLPESEESKKSIFVNTPIHNYQLKNTGGFAINLVIDKNNNYLPMKNRNTYVIKDGKYLPKDDYFLSLHK